MSTERRDRPIRRLARSAERRIRLGRALRVGARALCAALVVAIVDVAAPQGRARLAERPARVVLGAGGRRASSSRRGRGVGVAPARAGRGAALDRFHGLHDRLASALAFAERPEADRTPFMDAAIEDAVARSSAGPGRAPRCASRAAARSGRRRPSPAVLAGVLLFEVRRHVPVAHAKTIDPVEMAPDDLDDVKDFLKQVQQKDQSDETKAAIEEFNQLIDDIASQAPRPHRGLPPDGGARGEAPDRHARPTTRRSRRQLEQDRRGDEEGGAHASPPARRSPTTKLDQARDALHDLAKKLARARAARSTRPQLEQMREALQEGRRQTPRSASRSIEQRRQELADDILKQQGEDRATAARDEEQSLLEKKERELERLDREPDAAEERRPPARPPRPRARAGRRGPDEGPGRSAPRISTRAPRTSTGCSSSRCPSKRRRSCARSSRSCAS